MRKIQRLTALGALAALTVALGACGGSDEPTPTSAPAPAPSAPTSASAASPSAPSASAAPAGAGVTTTADIAGPGCGKLPAEGEGSVQGMVDDPVGIAANNNPQLSTLVATVKASNLLDTVNGATALTVFAPINSAFEALPPGVVDSLTTAPDVGQPNSKLTQILTTHVVGIRYDAEGLRKATKVPSLQGSELTIGGTAPDALTVSSGGEIANVVCANIPTANATVFLIDKVLLPAGS